MHPRDSGLYAIRFSSILLIIFLSAQQCLTSAHTPRSPKCVPGVFVLAARGSDETYHMPNVVNPAYADIGGLRNIANQIITAVGKGSYLEAVPYPATLNEYNVSLSHGIDAAQCMIRRYVDRCSGQIDPKMVLLGFSQGANVLSDALVGGVGSTGLLASKYGGVSFNWLQHDRRANQIRRNDCRRCVVRRSILRPIRPPARCWKRIHQWSFPEKRWS